MIELGWVSIFQSESEGSGEVWSRHSPLLGPHSLRYCGNLYRRKVRDCTRPLSFIMSRPIYQKFLLNPMFGFWCDWFAHGSSYHVTLMYLGAYDWSHILRSFRIFFFFFILYLSLLFKFLLRSFSLPLSSFQLLSLSIALSYFFHLFSPDQPTLRRTFIGGWHPRQKVKGVSICCASWSLEFSDSVTLCTRRTTIEWEEQLIGE